ncbi:unnamed protein product [Prorocentrum cordatum]|uniref:Uncharacterized protein n=1 Tax=Prorocentrum cordatum TaxID=2364126 RepID=A0ABN9WAJ5_9DINO|nr:unnamed protein product [Polarella glacialis]
MRQQQGLRQERPMGFEAGLCVRREQGNAESRLIEEETFQPGVLRPHRSKEEDEDRERQPLWRTEEESNRGSGTSPRSTRSTAGAAVLPEALAGLSAEDTEGPDVMRLG